MTAAHILTLTDARPITIRPAPRREPPFDDELADPSGPALLDGGLQPRLPFPEAPAIPLRRPPTAAADSVLDPVLGSVLGIPAAGKFGHTLVQGIVEVLNGLRPVAQLNSHLAPPIRAALQRNAEGLTRFRCSGRAPVVRSVHVAEPGPGIAEIAAVVDIGGRVRAIAARAEVTHGRWRCVRLQLG